jgi:hypothetical protein
MLQICTWRYYLIIQAFLLYVGVCLRCYYYFSHHFHSYTAFSLRPYAVYLAHYNRLVDAYTEKGWKRGTARLTLNSGG